MNDKSITFREVAGIFDSNTKLQAAINDLTLSHFQRHEINVLGSETAMKKIFATEALDPYQLIDNPLTPRNFNITSEEKGVGEGVAIGSGIMAGVLSALIAAGGVTISAAVPVAIVGGTVGAAFGELIATMIGDINASHLQKQLNQGGLILWVITTNKAKEDLACNILQKHAAQYVHIHDINENALA